MSSPEQVHQYLDKESNAPQDTGLSIFGPKGTTTESFAPPGHGTNDNDSEADTHRKFMSEAYAAANTEDKKPGLLKRLFGPKTDKPDVKKDEDKDDKDAVKLDKEGTIESLKLPKGFQEGKREEERNYVEFNLDGNDKTKVCYERRGDYNVTDKESKLLQDVLKKAPHKLTEQEVMDVNASFVPGSGPFANGNYKGKPNFHTEDVGGKRVLVGDFEFRDQDRKVHVIFFGQDQPNKKVEMLWVEGPAKDFNANKDAALDSFKHIKWTDAQMNHKKK